MSTVEALARLAERVISTVSEAGPAAPAAGRSVYAVRCDHLSHVASSCAEHRLSGTRGQTVPTGTRAARPARHRAVRGHRHLSRRKLLPGLTHLSLSALAPDV